MDFLWNGENSLYFFCVGFILRVSSFVILCKIMFIFSARTDRVSYIQSKMVYEFLSIYRTKSYRNHYNSMWLTWANQITFPINFDEFVTYIIRRSKQNKNCVLHKLNGALHNRTLNSLSLCYFLSFIPSRVCEFFFFRKKKSFHGTMCNQRNLDHTNTDW